MLTALIRKSRSVVRQVKPLWACSGYLGMTSRIKEFYNRRLLKQGVVETSILGTRLCFQVTTPAEIARIDNFASLEGDLVGRILTSLRPGDVVYDVGANVGMISVLIATSRRGDGIRVCAFEPEPANAAALLQNVRLNGVEETVEIHRVALGEAAGTAQLHVHGSAGCGTHSLIAGNGGMSIEVEVQTLAGFALRRAVPPDVAKIDVEGAEMQVLRGMSELLRSGAPRELFIEVHPAVISTQGLSIQGIESWLTDRGMELVWSQARLGEVHQHYRRRGVQKG